MGNRLTVLMLVVVTMLAVPALVLAQSAKGPAKAATTSTKQDLSGVWWTAPPGADAASKIARLNFTVAEPAMLPWAAERFKKVKEGMEDFPDLGRTDLDPTQYPYCMPFGMPRAYASGRVIEIVQGPTGVFVHFESNEVHRIYTDGRPRPEAPPLAFMGQSEGKWEGDTLVVETTDINELSWMDSMGHPHSDALRVEQRFRRVKHDTLEVDFLFDDPKTYTKPWRGKKVFRLEEDPSRNVIVEYFRCEDRSREEYQTNVLGKKKNP